MSADIIHKAEYLFPGSLFSEETVRVLPERSVEAAVEAAPKGCFCFTLYDTETAPDLGPDFKVLPVRKNVSGRYYLGGELYDVAAIESLASAEALDLSILASNMRANGWERVIRCVTGNWQPFTDGDVLVNPMEAFE